MWNNLIRWYSDNVRIQLDRALAACIKGDTQATERHLVIASELQADLRALLTGEVE